MFLIRPPHKEMVPNFKPKKTQNVNFEWFFGPNDLLCLFSHYILCPTGPIKRIKKLRYPPFPIVSIKLFRFDLQIWRHCLCIGLPVWKLCRK